MVTISSKGYNADCGVNGMANVMKYNEAEITAVITALDNAIDTINDKSLTALEDASRGASSLVVGSVSGVDDAIETAWLTIARLEAFKRKIKKYAEDTRQFDLDAADLLNSILDGEYDGFAFDENGNLIYGADGDRETLIPSYFGKDLLGFPPSPSVPEYVVDLTKPGTHGEDVTMPLSFIKQVMATMIMNGTTYDGSQTYTKLKLNKLGENGELRYRLTSECVGLIRLPFGTWYTLDVAKTIKTKVQGMYDQAKNKGVVEADTIHKIKYDGMMLAKDDFSHQAYYFKTFEADGKVYKDVIVDLRGKKYPEDPTKEEKDKIDGYNKKYNKIEINPASTEEFSNYKYYYDSSYIDYEDKNINDSIQGVSP